MGVRPPMSTTISSIESSAPVMDGDFLDKWISSALAVTLVSPSESLLSVGWACGALWYLYTVLLSVASSLEEARPIPGRSYLTPPREVLTSLFLLLLQHWWKFSNLFLTAGPTVCSTISNQLWALKLNYFPLKAHTIPHMSTLPLLGTITFIMYESRSVLRQHLYRPVWKRDFSRNRLESGDSHSEGQDRMGQSTARLTGLHSLRPWKSFTEEREPLWNLHCSV